MTSPSSFHFQTPRKLYLVLDFINGGHLFFQLYRQGTFDEPLARLYTAELVLAIAHLHSLGFVHRCSMHARVGGCECGCGCVARLCTEQLVLAIAHLHSLGIVHRCSMHASVDAGEEGRWSCGPLLQPPCARSSPL